MVTVQALLALARAAQCGRYAEGMAAGCELTLRMLLGHADHGGVPYSGPVPAELRDWAEQALRRVRLLGEAGGA